MPLQLMACSVLAGRIYWQVCEWDFPAKYDAVQRVHILLVQISPITQSHLICCSSQLAPNLNAFSNAAYLLTICIPRMDRLACK